MHPSSSPASLSWRKVLRFTVLLFFVINGQSSPAYSVLTHEQIVDMLWRDQIRPILLARYPTATDADLREAHAYA